MTVAKNCWVSGGDGRRKIMNSPVMPLKWMELGKRQQSGDRGHRKHGSEDPLANQSVHFQINSVVCANVFIQIKSNKLNNTGLQTFLVYTRQLPQNIAIRSCLNLFLLMYLLYWQENTLRSCTRDIEIFITCQTTQSCKTWVHMYFAIFPPNTHLAFTYNYTN